MGPARCQAKLVLPYRERRGVGLGNLGDFQTTPTPGTSQALPVHLGLEASSERKTFPLRFLGLLQRCEEGQSLWVERGTGAGR